MTAFATVTDLANRLNRTFEAGAETSWIEKLLDDASTYLREDVLGGQNIFPQATIEAELCPNLSGWIDLPQRPVQSVTSVTRDGVAVDYTRRGDSIQVADSDPVDVTFIYGLAAAPESLVRWTCVLVSQVLVTLELKLGLTVGGLSSIQIDDFRAAFADAGEQTGMALSDRNIRSLRNLWGTGNLHVVEAVR